MFYNNIDPVLAHLGIFEIRYYGLIFAAGLIISFFLINYLARKKGLDLKPVDVEEFFIYSIIGLVVGARLAHAFVYNPAYYLANPAEVFAVWNGGLAFHGGLVGLLAAGLFFCKKKKIHFYDLADIVVIPVALALALGRIGNYTNSELYGKVTGLPWGVKFEGVDGFRHPTQIYEAAKNLFIFSVLWLLNSRNLPRGFVFWTFIALYGALRFSLEFYRAEEVTYLGLSLGQFFSAAMLITGVIMLSKLKRFK